MDPIYLKKEPAKPSTQEDPNIFYPHPYQYELENIKYEDWMLEQKPERLYAGFDKTKVYWVDTKEKLEKLSEKLDNVTEFAVDMEAHMYRSFQGFTCLIQISTRDEDFLIDCIELRKHVHILNSSFTNPKIVKIFHGADMDIQWLQRDFGVYVVNMFDTGQACRVLNFPSLALSYLIKHFCSISVDKQYQRADWRVRPLPEEMLKYARGDTHYLLYIHDRLKSELISKSREDNNLLLAVLDRSRDICLTRYEKEILTEESYLKLFDKFNVQYNTSQLRVFEALYNWRDKIARLEDESTRFVLPNHMLFHIAENIPQDRQSLYALCNPVPPLLKMHCLEVIDLIKTAATRSDIESSIVTRPVEVIKKMETPITSTEQLCKEAGWIEEEEEVIPSRQAVIPSISMDSGTLSGNVVLGELEDEAENLSTLEDIKKSFSIDLFIPKFVDEAPIEVKVSKKPLDEKATEPKVNNKKRKSSDIFEGIPQSMQEVYKMANTNKKKKKKRDHNGQNKAKESLSPFYLNDGTQEKDIRKKRKTSEKPIKEVMREIHWDSGDN